MSPGCQVFGRDVSPASVPDPAEREKLDRLAGHRDPAHVLWDIPIPIGVAVVIRPANTKPPALPDGRSRQTGS